MVKFVLPFFSLLLFSSCIIEQRTFYNSPENGAVPVYRPSIVQSDSLRSALHVQGGIAFGTANETERDKLFSAHAGISRSHSAKGFGAHYGAMFTLGNYRVDSVLASNSTFDPTYVRTHKGNKMFGTYGVDGAVHFNANYKDVEWRVLGVETSLRQEFGDYLQFRKDMPANGSTRTVRSSFFATAGAFTEVLVNIYDTRIGFKLGVGDALGSDYTTFVDPNQIDEPVGFLYTTGVASLTNKRISFFAQIIDTKLGQSFVLGSAFRLHK